MGMFYSFEEFHEAGQWHDDLGPYSNGLDLTGVCGRLYLGTLWIQSLGNDLWATAGHGHDEWIGGLAVCERHLYDFAISNGNFEALTSTDDLADALSAYCAEQGLGQQCAMELICEDITPAQRAWLSDFINMWEAIEESEDMKRAIQNRGESV